MHWSTGKKRINIDWTSVELGHTLIKSENRNVLHRHLLDHVHIDILTVLINKMRIVTKSKDPHLDGIDCYLELELLDEFYFIKPKGWRRVNELRSAD